MKTMDAETFGRVEPGKKALIIYATISGNTKRVAETFEKVLLHYGFEVDLYQAKNVNEYLPITGYDLYLVGSGIVAGMPERNLLAAFGAGNYTNMKQLAEIGGDTGAPQWGRGVKLSKGIIFLTYGGNRRGPSETLASEAILEMMMTEMGIQPMGVFTCPGTALKNQSHNQTDDLAKALNVGVEVVAPMLQAYLDDPECEEVLSWTPDVRELVRKASQALQPMDLRLLGMPRPWHNDTVVRPNERDLVKAEIFLSEFIEDVFLPEEAESVDTKYICKS